MKSLSTMEGRTKRLQSLIRYAMLWVACLMTPLAASAQSLIYFNTQNLTVSSGSFRSGGPPKDGIPALTRPDRIVVESATEWRPEDRIIAVRRGGEVIGYPIPILNWHEIVNDVIGGIPIAVIYCPLCDSVSVVERRLGDKVLEFGVSGLLYESNVVMYDRVDNALWSQVGLTALSGPHAGQSLAHLPWEILSFAQFKDKYPGSKVLVEDTGHARSYRNNPYAAYLKGKKPMFSVSRNDRRLDKMEPVIGIRMGDQTSAYTVESVLRAPGGALIRNLQGHRLRLEADATGWVAVTEIPPGAQVVHTFWYAWAALHPETSVHK